MLPVSIVSPGTILCQNMSMDSLTLGKSMYTQESRTNRGTTRLLSTTYVQQEFVM